MSKESHTPNDNRSIVKNTNNPAHAADIANRNALGHGNVPPPAPAAQPGQNPSK